MTKKPTPRTRRTITPRAIHAQARRWPALRILVTAFFLVAALPAAAQDYTSDFDPDLCTFATAGNNHYFPLWPGYALLLEGEEEDDGEIVELSVLITVTTETEMVDGVLTRVVEEREEEDGELVEISRNFMAICRETGDLWYFGEDVDDYEDGEIVGHGGAWRSGIAGARAGILVPATPMIGARHFQEQAPGVALDRAEIVSVDETLEVPAGTFEDVLMVAETSPLDPPSAVSEKWYAPGVGLIKDEEIELVEIRSAPCLPNATTLCLNDGRFRVQVEWEDGDNGEEGQGLALLPSGDSGEFYFFTPNNTELLVKVLNACDLPAFESFWVFAGGLTDVGVTLTVTDTATGITREYESPDGQRFQPIQDTQAFTTCP